MPSWGDGCAISDIGPRTGLGDRRLGTFDAVVIGLGSMIGAGIFAALGPAAAAAGIRAAARSR